jgi:hypothetical protein
MAENSKRFLKLQFSRTAHRNMSEKFQTYCGIRSEKFQTFCGLPSPDSKFELDTLKRCSIYIKLKKVPYGVLEYSYEY